MKIFNEKITSLQVHDLYRHLKISLAGLVGIVVIIAAVLYIHYQNGMILVWAALMVAINGYRYYTYVRYYSKTEIQKAGVKKALLEYVIPAGLSGFTFSCIVYFFFPPDPEFEVFLLILLSGIISAGVVQNAHTKITVRVFLVATLLPLIAFFLQYNTYLFNILAATLIFYFFLIIKISDYLYKEHVKTKTLQQEYHSLIRRYETDRQRMDHFFNYTPVGVFFYKPNLEVTYVNEFLAKNILGVSKEKLVGLNLENLKDKRFLPALKESFEFGHGVYEGGYHTTLSDKDLWIKLIASRVETSRGHYEGVAVMVDLSELKEAQSEIEHLAYFDELTDIPKRGVIINEINKAIALYKRQKLYSALIYFDLDKFKDINDFLGHNVGDRFLQHVAKQASEAIRESDVIARMGGDEFAILLPALSSKKEEATIQAMEIAKRIRDYAAKDFTIEKRVYNASLSMGIVLIDDEQKDVYDIIKAADTAMYTAKKERQNGIVIFDEALAKEVQKKYTLRDELLEAFKKQQFVLYFQPKISKENRIVSAEALVRWQHPTRGMLTPDVFLPVVMEFNLMHNLTDRIILLAHDASWKLPKEFILSLNISASDILSEDFVSMMEQAAPSFGCRIDLELTEQMLINNAEVSKNNMRRLHEAGVEFSIDDFGTGYSSLMYLKQLPLDYLKIDKSFIDDMLEDANDLSIVKTIIAMAHSLGLQTVAEGVETKEQYEMLLDLGCDFFQGYFFSKPVVQEAFLEKLNEA